MESSISFAFRGQQYSATYTICKKEYPVYIYITLMDEVLIKEFGEDIVIHSRDGALLVDHIFTAHVMSYTMPSSKLWQQLSKSYDE